ncbi:hypothetical protein BJV82DRAFT_660146 [Fennellomyces sp. T-0311]|nr:hypothetical protein BJV82DRAFT_660146 [Fennellomyces sp. T-0311]
MFLVFLFIKFTILIAFIYMNTKVPMNHSKKVQCCICLEDYIDYSSWVPILGSLSRYPPPPPPKDWQVNLVHSAGCNHYICRHCLKTYLERYLNVPQDSYDRIRCPQYKCKRAYAAATIVEKVMPNRTAIDRWWLRVYEKTVMDSIGYCPYQNCKAIFELPHEVPEKENLPRFAQCVECHRGLCMNCQNVWHSGTSCREGQSSGTPTWQFSQKYHTEREKRKKTLARKNSLEARQLAMSKNWTRCPKCKQMIEKSNGCNHVTCRCGADFCHRCGSYLNDSNGCSVACGGFSKKKLKEFRKHMFQYDS